MQKSYHNSLFLSVISIYFLYIYIYIEYNNNDEISHHVMFEDLKVQNTFIRYVKLRKLTH